MHFLTISFRSAPSRPPSNVTGEASSSSSLILTWKPVDKLHINGVLRYYIIVYFVTHSPGLTRQNISIPVTSGRRRRAISDPSAPSFELSGLKKYTGYTIQVLAYTVDYGVPSHEVNMTTAQDGNYTTFILSRVTAVPYTKEGQLDFLCLKAVFSELLFWASKLFIRNKLNIVCSSPKKARY